MGIFDHRQQELDKRSRVEGVTLADVIELPEPWRTAMNRMMRADSMTLNGLSAELNLDAAETCQIAEMLVEKGFLSSMSHDSANSGK
jgi:hypothetical protein